VTTSPPVWHAVHVAYGSVVERHDLIVERLAPLTDRLHWFFADGVDSDVLEVAVLGAEAIVLAITPPNLMCLGPHAPCVLQIVEGEGDAVRVAYAHLLALDSARAVALLSALRPNAADDAVDEIIANDLALIYTAAAPNAADRLAMLRDYADWLRRVEGRTGTVDRRRRPTFITASFPASPDLVLGRASDDLRLAAQGDGAGSFAALTARRAHMQVVRLRGPRGTYELPNERRLVEFLADKLTTSST
jgi:hypothetical protein